MGYYVYRFLDNNEKIVYVGKTGNLKNRMSQHFSSKGHLAPTQYNQVKNIEYIELPTKIDMDIRELYYINLWKPEFNTIHAKHDTVETISLSPDNWLQWNPSKDIEIERLKNLVSSLEIELMTSKEGLEQENITLKKENEALKKRVYLLDKELSDGKLSILKYENESKHSFKGMTNLNALLDLYNGYRFNTLVKSSNPKIISCYKIGDNKFVDVIEANSVTTYSQKDLSQYHLIMSTVMVIDEYYPEHQEMYHEMNNSLIEYNEKIERDNYMASQIRELIWDDVNDRDVLDLYLNYFNLKRWDDELEYVYKYIRENNISNRNELKLHIHNNLKVA